jgi:protein-disulfide isomerase
MKKLKLLGVLILLVLGQFSVSFVQAEDKVATRDTRVEVLKKGGLNEIVYGADNPKAVIHVFTDLNCGYCRKLHHEVGKLNESGVQVRFLAMPRQGVGSPGYNKMVSVWCSSDPKETLGRAMEGEALPQKSCKNPVKDHLTLAEEWGVIGTPTIVFADGTIKAGYSSVDRLVREAMRRSGKDE